MHKKAIMTSDGLWEFLQMPSGLRNASQTFQGLRNSILQALPFAFCYLDDVLVASPSPALHLEHPMLCLSGWMRRA